MTTNASPPDKMKRKDYEKHLRKLQVELCHLQEWVKQKGSRVIIVFEGRDAAGKGGTIKAIAEKVSPGFFALLLFRLLRTVKSQRCTFNGISSSFQPRAKSLFSIAAGTIAQALNM